RLARAAGPLHDPVADPDRRDDPAQEGEERQDDEQGGQAQRGTDDRDRHQDGQDRQDERPDQAGDQDDAGLLRDEPLGLADLARAEGGDEERRDDRGDAETDEEQDEHRDQEQREGGEVGVERAGRALDDDAGGLLDRPVQRPDVARDGGPGPQVG